MIVTKKAIARRTVLRGMGATLALPWLDAMVPALARAAVTTPVKRLGVVYVPNGIFMPNWTPSTEGPDFKFTPHTEAAREVPGSAARRVGHRFGRRWPFGRLYVLSHEHRSKEF